MWLDGIESVIAAVTAASKAHAAQGFFARHCTACSSCLQCELHEQPAANLAAKVPTVVY
jgi:hypothetical protein